MNVPSNTLLIKFKSDETISIGHQVAINSNGCLTRDVYNNKIIGYAVTSGVKGSEIDVAVIGQYDICDNEIQYDKDYEINKSKSMISDNIKKLINLGAYSDQLMKEIIDLAICSNIMEE